MNSLPSSRITRIEFAEPYSGPFSQLEERLIAAKIDYRNYYDFLPPNVHRTGDIWRNLPTFGTLAQQIAAAVVITPACDLQNRKCETITYIPIISVEEFLCSRAFYFEIWNEINGTLSNLNLADRITKPSRFELPLVEQIRSVIGEAPQRAAESSIQKLNAYCEFISSIATRKKPRTSAVAPLFTKKRFETILSGIVRNSYRTDIHFLPWDGKPQKTSAVPRHSVALFRYPLSIPADILDAAQASNPRAWLRETARLAKRAPVATLCEGWPVRMATLRDDFLADLVSRYVTMYIRLGSRDFTDQTVANFVKELG